MKASITILIPLSPYICFGTFLQAEARKLKAKQKIERKEDRKKAAAEARAQEATA